MERIESILNDIREESENRYQESRIQILKEYTKNKSKVTERICGVFAAVFQNAIKMQESNKKNPVCCICIFCLRSSCLTGSHQYHISLYDRKFYLDRQEVCIDYTPDIIIPYFRSDIEYLIKVVRKQYIRLKNYEVERITLMHMEHYHMLMKEIFENTIDSIKNLPEYTTLSKTGDHMFLYGEYRDKAVRLGINA